ncbi:SUKH-4 family immunity protein [Streptomyces sp. 4F14]|uniref:SUKH-4 family immunity protein n=1 Tax=Streptomyces sp. 4F14 TaxID=3394380 RepID=UPI003A895019
MVTFAQAQERAEEWVNGDVPVYQHREVRVREFGLGFVVWAEDRAEGPRGDGGAQRLVIARDSGEATLWPSLPVGEVIRRYEERYGGEAGVVADAVPAAPARVDLNQTSFLLTPPEWLQDAADKLGIGERGDGVTPGAGAGVGGPGAGAGVSGQPAAPVVPGAPGVSGGSTSGGGPSVPAGATPWAGTDTNGDGGEDRSVPLPATVFAPPLSDGERGRGSGVAADAPTALMSGGSQLPPTAVAPALGAPGGGGPEGSAYGYPQTAGGPGGVNAGGPGGVSGPGVPNSPTAGGHQGVGAPGSGVPGRVPGGGAPNSPVPGGAQGVGAPGSGVPGGAPGTGAPNSTAPGGVPGAGLSNPGVPGGVPGAGPSNPGVPGGVQGAGVPNSGVPGGAQGVPGAPQTVGAGGPGAQGGASQEPASAGRGLAPNAGDIADAATSRAAPPPRRGRGGAGAPPPPPGAPGVPGGGAGAGGPAGPAGAYVPTQLVSALEGDLPGGAGGAGGPGAPVAPGSSPGTPPVAPPGTPPGMPAGAQPPAAGRPGPGQPGAGQAPGAVPPPPPGAPGAPGAPQPPGAPGTPGTPGAVHQAETMLAAPPPGGPGMPPPPPGAPGVPGAPPNAPGMPPGAPGVPGAQGAAPFPGAPAAPPGAFPGTPPGVPGGAATPPPPPVVPQGMPPAAYGYPNPAGQPIVGPGYQAVLRYRAQDGSEQQLIRRSAPGTPHPEWQIFHELRGMNVPPGQVLELHTELESCELPGAYCARMIREQWPQARITSIAPYGTDHASRQQGMQQLLAHQGELHQVADGPARPAPVRAPLPPVQQAPAVPPEAIGQELAAAFGPGVFRFEQAAVARQGVPPVVAHTLVAAGLPLDMGPFFWAQAQPGRPVPTLAELAQERGVQPSADAGSYLVMGSDFGKAICVQYGTANIVAVPVEAGPGGAPVAPQFVNSGLPEFARCLALLGRMWRLRFGLNPEQAARWTVDFQAQLASLDPAALGSPDSWWSVLLEQMWDGLL